ncbi:hypothetical protein AK830_g7887 [Neonectria ditissima]|uniref:Zn(2)-C6 fungal-type domain-containing protein n=1 Tax=Neonectria ditissima TaxID=78410 RepID=A0A0P7AVZ2_9HYPO|nr:hypothetical protein AK830_g7887 [Neonectria ditissima]
MLHPDMKTDAGPVQYLEQRLAELQRGTPERQRADAERLPHVLNRDRQHDQILDIATAPMEKHTTASLLNSHTVLQHRSKLFYPSERPPLKIPVQGIYHDTYTRTAGQEYGIQFSHFNARKMPLDVAARLFDNYMDNILPRFPCFMEEDLSEQFRQFYHETGDDDTRSSTTEFIVTIILAISSLSSKRHDFRKVAALSESLHADAMRHVAFLRDASIMSLQCLLLLIQLALLLPHTGNLWYLSGEAMRMAVSLGLHQDPETTIISGPVYGEIRRRLFWVTYQLDRTVAIAAGCPIALSDEHITTQLPFNGGHRHVNLSEYMAGLSPAPKEKQFLIQTYVCLIQSEIHAVQFFDHPIPARASDYDTWVQQTEMSVRNLVEQVRADGVATPWLVSAAHQCQVLLHRPCSRNLAVSESSLVAAATASIDLINTSLESVINGGFVVVFELANSAFQAGMVLLYALRNHASELQQASLIKRSESALEDLGKLFDGLSRRWPALSDTKYYLKQLVDTNLRNPVGNYGSEYDMNVLEELDCLVTQRRIHSIYHRNIPLPIPLKGTPQSDASSQISPGFLDDDTWWRYFINEDFDMEDRALQPNTPMPAPALEIQKVTPEDLDPPAWNPNLSNSRTTYDKILDTLPACSFCRDRRIKCHQQLPACKECFRTSRECMFFDPILSENIPLRRICSLVDMIESLEERHAASFAVMPQRSLPDDPSRTPPRAILVPTPCALDQSASLPYEQTRFAPSKSFFGPWSSLGFLATVMKRRPLWNSTRTIQTAFEMFEPVSISTLTPHHRPPMSVASGLFGLFSMSANTFFPILDASSLKGIISECYDAGDDARFGHTQELFYLILAIAATIARNEPVLAAWSKAYFDKAINQLDPSCDHSSRHANISLLQRTLLICIYLLLSPESGDIWRHLGFAIRLFFDLSHRPSLDKDEDDSLFCTLTRTLYCLESQVSIAFGRPSLLIIGDTLRDVSVVWILFGKSFLTI